MTLYHWAGVEREQVNPLLTRQAIHGERMTVARIHLGKGCVVRAHAHEQEQITVLEEGRLRFQIEGREVVLGAGDVLEVPSNAPHGVEALEDTVVFDIFSPPRADWRKS
ncbi:MAG: cupin domain-containing protein [Bryobacteraceae bacterium]|jgi:quercetin dioxygenase-like cupin family protein